MKLCPICLVEKPDDAYYRLKSGRLFSYCRECQTAKKRAWRQGNRERARASNQAYADRHRERVRAAGRVRYASMSGADRARRREYMQAYREANRDRIRSMIRAWQLKNWDRYISLARDSESRRRARMKGVRVVRFDRAAIIARDGGRCHLCGTRCRPSEIELDHLVPLSAGGDHAPENVAVACRSCNRSRGAGRLPAQLLLIG